jgi:hypothetical protein
VGFPTARASPLGFRNIFGRVFAVPSCGRKADRTDILPQRRSTQREKRDLLLADSASSEVVHSLRLHRSLERDVSRGLSFGRGRAVR